jgi:hypothetical protein
MKENSSRNVAKFLYEDVICRHGCPVKVVMDGGSENKKIAKSCWRIIKFIGLSFLLTILKRMDSSNADTTRLLILCRNTAVRNLKTGSNIYRLHYGRIVSQHEEAQDIQRLNCCTAVIVCYLSICLCHHGE